MDVAVARVHVQGHKYAAAHHFGVDFCQTLHDFGVGFAAENFRQGFHYIGFNRHAQTEIAEGDKAAFMILCLRVGKDGFAVTLFVFAQRRIEVGKQPFPALFHRFNMGKRVLGAVA